MPDSLLGERIKQARLTTGLTQEELAVVVGTNAVSIYRYESGLHIPKLDITSKLANALNCNLTWLVTGQGDMKNPFDGLKGVSQLFPIPVYGKISAGNPAMSNNDIIEYISLPGAPANSAAMIVNGDSMTPTIKHDDYVVFLQHDDVRNGDIVVISNEYGELMVKRYRIKDEVGYFVSDNPEYQTIKVNGGHKLIGKVVTAWSKRQLGLSL